MRGLCLMVCLAKGGEGLVFKPTAFTVQGSRGLIQPAMKVRGRDYLRIIYGPDYDLPENIERLRQRGLGRKFSLVERGSSWAWKGCTALSKGCRCRKFTNVRWLFWHWRVNRLIPGCKNWVFVMAHSESS